MITIEYVPYVGLIYMGEKFVRTTMKDGKLHFFQVGNSVSCDELNEETIQKLIDGNIEGSKYLGYVELKK